MNAVVLDSNKLFVNEKFNLFTLSIIDPDTTQYNREAMKVFRGRHSILKSCSLTVRHIKGNFSLSLKNVSPLPDFSIYFKHAKILIAVENYKASYLSVLCRCSKAIFNGKFIFFLERKQHLIITLLSNAIAIQTIALHP